MTLNDRKWEFEHWLGEQLGVLHGGEVWDQLERWYAWGRADTLKTIKQAVEEAEHD